MEQTSQTLSESIQCYEEFFKPLTSTYPFDFSINFAYGGHPIPPNLKISLNADGTFKANYLLLNLDRYEWAYYDAKGTFQYSPSDHTLTLKSDPFLSTVNMNQGITEGYNLNKESIEKFVEATYNTWTINDYYWGSTSFVFPYVVLPFMEGSQDVHDYTKPFVTYVDAKLDYYGNSDFNAAMDLVKVLTNFKISGKVPAKTITESVSYGDLKLNPDGTLIYYSDNSSWDRDGPYNWDSSFKAEGKWAYDSNTKVMKLFYENFHINNDGEIMNPFSYDLPKEDETKNFYFDRNFISSFEVKWYLATFAGVSSFQLAKK